MLKISALAAEWKPRARSRPDQETQRGLGFQPGGAWGQTLQESWSWSPVDHPSHGTGRGRGHSWLWAVMRNPLLSPKASCEPLSSDCMKKPHR